MSDLHSPMGLDGKEPKKRPWGLVAAGVIAVAMISFAAYVFIDSRKQAPTVVAIDTSVPKPVTSPAAVESQEPVVDDSEIKPLSPLEPLSPVDMPSSAEAEQPNFSPQPNPQSTNRPKWQPIPDLIEVSEFGPLPRISAGGMRPLDAYSQASGGQGANRIAIVIGGLGISQTGTQEAIQKLPSGVTLAFSPAGNSLNRWAQTAMKEGHEVALQVPMEPLGYPSVDPGPRTLTVEGIGGANLKNLRATMGRMTNYPVVMNYLGASFSARDDALRPMLREMNGRGLAYFDDGSVQASTAVDIAKDLRMPHASGNLVIERSSDPARIRAQLEAVELLARNRGFAIVTASAFPETIDAVTEWAEAAGKRGILIVPLSTLIKDYRR